MSCDRTIRKRLKRNSYCGAGKHMSHKACTLPAVWASMWCGGLALLMLASLGASHATAQEAVSVPWRPGNSALFQAGTSEEQGKRALQGVLPVRLYRPDIPGRIPFVVLLHGCGGLHYETMWQKWVEPWASLFGQQRIGIAPAAVLRRSRPLSGLPVRCRQPFLRAVTGIEWARRYRSSGLLL